MTRIARNRICRTCGKEARIIDPKDKISGEERQAVIRAFKRSVRIGRARVGQDLEVLRCCGGAWTLEKP